MVNTIRAFLAIVPPAESLTPLAEVVSELRRAYPSLGWVAPERWHVTLAFLGQVSEGQASRLALAGDAVDLRVEGGGMFPRVVWAGVAGDLSALAREARTAARRVGISLERRPFRAHLTLARVRRPFSDGAAVVDALRDVSGPPWTATEVVLFRSHLGPRPVYEPLRTWRLGQPCAGYQA